MGSGPFWRRVCLGTGIGVVLYVPFFVASREHASRQELDALTMFLPIASFAVQFPFWLLRMKGYRIVFSNPQTAEHKYSIRDFLVTTALFAILMGLVRANSESIGLNVAVLVLMAVLSGVFYGPILYASFRAPTKWYWFLGSLGFGTVLSWMTSMDPRFAPFAFLVVHLSMLAGVWAILHTLGYRIVGQTETSLTI